MSIDNKKCFNTNPTPKDKEQSSLYKLIAAVILLVIFGSLFLLIQYVPMGDKIFMDSFSILFHIEYLWPLAIIADHDILKVIFISLYAFTLAHLCSYLLGYILSRISQSFGYNIENLSFAYFIKKYEVFFLIAVAFTGYFGAIMSFFYGYTISTLKCNHLADINEIHPSFIEMIDPAKYKKNLKLATIVNITGSEFLIFIISIAFGRLFYMLIYMIWHNYF